MQIANPNSSGTAYTTLATIVQLLGEEAGFDYLKALHKNVNQYTKSGSAPIKAAARGETTIGIVFLHDAVTQAVNGFPVRPVAPCEGTGYEIGSMSIIKNARNADSAKKFYDWALGEASQSLMPQAKAYQVPSNAAVEPPPQAPKVSEIKLIDYDFAKYGSSAERKRLLAKWDAEVKESAPVDVRPHRTSRGAGTRPPRRSTAMHVCKSADEGFFPSTLRFLPAWTFPCRHRLTWIGPPLSRGLKAFAGRTAGDVPGCVVRIIVSVFARGMLSVLDSSFPRKVEAIRP